MQELSGKSQEKVKKGILMQWENLPVRILAQTPLPEGLSSSGINHIKKQTFLLRSSIGKNEDIPPKPNKNCILCHRRFRQDGPFLAEQARVPYSLQATRIPRFSHTYIRSSATSAETCTEYPECVFDYQSLCRVGFTLRDLPVATSNSCSHDW